MDKQLEPYKYKDQVEIPALGWIDDIITVSESGYKTSRMNVFINAQLAIKKLRLGAKKCVTLHVGKHHEEYKHVQLFVDGWSVKNVESYDAEETKWEDTHDQDMKEISHLDSEKYLGQILSSDSKNTNNITKLRNKGIGIKNKIIQILHNIPGGVYHFELAMIFRSSYLLSSILSNSEVWYGITKSEIELLERLDVNLLQEVSECSRSVPHELYYLEFGVLPISYIIKIRKQMFLHHILHQEEQSLLYRFFMAQLNSPTKGDWATEVLQDTKYLDLNLDLEDIKNMPKSSFRRIVETKTTQKALEYLLEKQGSRNSEHAKGKLLSYDELKMAEFLSPSQVDISIEEKKWLIKCRFEDIDISCNNRWKNENLYCTNCILTEIDQQHLFLCNSLLGKNEIVGNLPVYEDLYLKVIYIISQQFIQKWTGVT